MNSTLELACIIWLDDFGIVILLDFVALISSPWFIAVIIILCLHTVQLQTSLNPGYKYMFQTILLLYNLCEVYPAF